MEEVKPWYRRAWGVALIIIGLLLILGIVLFVRQTYIFYAQLKQGGHPVPGGSRDYSGVVASQPVIDTAGREDMKHKVEGQLGEPFAGPASATHEIVEFLDFDCPYCKASLSTVHDILRLRPDVKFIVRDFPLVDLHPDAETAARAARCMWRQGVPAMYWRYYDQLFGQQDQRDVDTLVQWATQMGADSRFATCLQAGLADAAIRQSIVDATAAGVSVTPTFFVDGLKIEGAADTQTLLNSLAP